MKLLKSGKAVESYLHLAPNNLKLIYSQEISHNKFAQYLLSENKHQG